MDALASHREHVRLQAERGIVAALRPRAMAGVRLHKATLHYLAFLDGGHLGRRARCYGDDDDDDGELASGLVARLGVCDDGRFLFLGRDGRFRSSADALGVGCRLVEAGRDDGGSLREAPADDTGISRWDRGFLRRLECVALPCRQLCDTNAPSILDAVPEE